MVHDLSICENDYPNFFFVIYVWEEWLSTIEIKYKLIKKQVNNINLKTRSCFIAVVVDLI